MGGKFEVFDAETGDFDVQMHKYEVRQIRKSQEMCDSLPWEGVGWGLMKRNDPMTIMALPLARAIRSYACRP